MDTGTQQSLVFSELTEQDIELVRNWRNSPEVSKYMYTDTVITPEQQERWFSNLGKDTTQKHWMITYESKKVGLVYLSNINHAFRTCYWGFYLGETPMRGSGLGKKIEFKLLEYVFEEMKFDKLLGEVLAFNENVLRMHEKFGFKREGYFREHILKNNARHDVISIALLRSEWEVLKREFYKMVWGENEK